MAIPAVSFDERQVRQLRKRMNSLKWDVAKKMLREGVKAGGREMRKIAKRRIKTQGHDRTGLMRKALAVKTSRKKFLFKAKLYARDIAMPPPKTAEVDGKEIKVRRSQQPQAAKYLHLLEGGTDPHAQPNNPLMPDGQHPGAEPAHILRDTIMEDGDAIHSRFVSMVAHQYKRVTGRALS
jgi:hypothetical protein